MAETTRNEAEKIIRNILSSFYIKISYAKEYESKLCPEGQLIVSDFYSALSGRKRAAVLQAINDKGFFKEISDDELLMYVQFCQQISEFYGLDAQEFERVRGIRPSGAWVVRNRWNDCFIGQYHIFVLTNAKEYIGAEKYTCEDFALALLIDFSVKNELPVIIKNGFNAYDSQSPRFKTIAEFKETVFNRNAANHLMENTVSIDVNDAKPGDLILMDTGFYGGQKDEIINHVIVIIALDGDFLLLAQGNHSGKKVKRAYYGTNQYQGEPVATRKYNRKTDVYYGAEPGQGVYPDAIKGFGMQFRRWKFKEMGK